MTLALGGCGTSFDAQTNQVYQPGVGANGRGDIDALHALVVANADGTATLSAALENNLDEEQSLSSVTVATLGGEELQVTGPDGELPLAPGQLTTLGGLDPAGVFIIDEDAVAGAYVEITFTFSDSAPMTLEAPVVTRTSEFAGVVEAPEDEPATEEPATEEPAAEEELATEEEPATEG